MNRAALRRYPALGFLAVAAALALLLPSRLSVPRADPSGMSEFAPLPDGAGTGDLATLTEAGGRSLDLTGTRERTPPIDPATELRSPGSLRQPSTGTKRCVGRPPRQTEDPLSPPCVASFSGDNGGATTKGVTADEIEVVYYEGCDRTNTDEEHDLDAPESATYRVPLAAYARYFNERYQTYGRHVHITAARYNCADPFDPATQRTNAIRLEQRFGPFAMFGGDEPAVIETARSRTLIQLSAPRRSLTREYAPYIQSFPPDYEDHIGITNAFLCSNLVGKRARLSGNPADTGRTRRFGVMYLNTPEEERDARDLVADLQRRCPDVGEIPMVTASAPAEFEVAVASLRSEQVTTVIQLFDRTDWYLVTSSNGWYPEWFFPSSPLPNHAVRVLPPTVSRTFIALSYGRRRGPFAQQPWVQAMHEACPSCRVDAANTGFGPALYDSMLLLFTGIQSAGPRLTPQTLDVGLHSIPARQSTDPFAPSAYFAPGNWSFVKDAMLAWWDPAGDAPDTDRPGCFRLVDDGGRFRERDWTDIEDRIGAPGQVCQGESVAEGG